MRLDCASSWVYSRWFGIPFAWAHKSYEIQMSSLKSAQKWMALIATNTNMDEYFLTDMDSVFSGGGNTHLGEVCKGTEPFHATKGLSRARPSSLPSPSSRLCGCVRLHDWIVPAHRNSCSGIAETGENIFSREPSSQTAMHISHFPPLKMLLRCMLNRPANQSVKNPLNKHLILQFRVFKIQGASYWNYSLLSSEGNLKCMKN